MNRTLLCLALSGAVVALGACAVAPDKAASGASAPTPAVASAPTPATSPPAAVTTTASGLKIIDHKVGSGKEALVGKAALVQYTGWLYDEKARDNKGREFDSSAKREGLPFGFVVGVGRVIKGWDQGVVGMKVGGKRTLVIPADLAYGDKEVGNGLIPPNSTLVFDIELVEVTP